MEKDMRISYPLWQMGFIVILMGLLIMIGSFSEYKSMQDQEGYSYEFIFFGVPFWITLSWSVVGIAYMILYVARIKRHNKQNPAHHINLFTMKPQEYMKDDELFEVVTMRATKNVYSYFSIAIPSLFLFMLFAPIGKIALLNGLLLLAIGQYIVYYLAIRKYVIEESDCERNVV